MARPTSQQVFDKAFAANTAPRSEAFKQGVLTCLQVRLEGTQYNGCPFQEGTHDWREFFAGMAEGRKHCPIGQIPADQTGHLPVPFRLLAVVAVDQAHRVRCQQPGCGRPVYARIHIVEKDGVLTVLGSDCFAQHYGEVHIPRDRGHDSTLMAGSIPL